MRRRVNERNMMDSSSDQSDRGKIGTLPDIIEKQTTHAQSKAKKSKQKERKPHKANLPVVCESERTVETRGYLQLCAHVRACECV